MKIDQYGQFIYSEQDLCDLYLADPERKLQKVLVDDDINLPKSLDLDDIINVISYDNNNISIEEFDKINQNNWRFPKEYQEMDIAKYVLDQCKNDEELQRAGMELLLFQERDMFMLLKYLKYLIDTMKSNNIIWGVGRGSSVASFVLYLLGVHRINSLYYDLSIEEFLK
jgi:DNA polymerase III alpha subunit